MCGIVLPLSSICVGRCAGAGRVAHCATQYLHELSLCSWPGILSAYCTDSCTYSIAALTSTPKPPRNTLQHTQAASHSTRHSVACIACRLAGLPRCQRHRTVPHTTMRWSSPPTTAWRRPAPRSTQSTSTACSPPRHHVPSVARGLAIRPRLQHRWTVA